MTEVISVKFRNLGKAYYFSPGEMKIEAGQNVIVETAKGMEYGDCVRSNHEVDDSLVVQPLRPVIRIATEEDRRTVESNRVKEKQAFAICEEKIAEHGLDMKLVDVEIGIEGNKMLFFFTSDGRVDFRELVKDLASAFKTRIELRQIGVRDEAKMLGGLGICGKPFCCASFLSEFQPVSIKMAKTQNLSLNPAKISGACGRLMCCLKYEQDAYEDLIKRTPKPGTVIDTPAGKGTVSEVNLLRQKVKVSMEGDDSVQKFFRITEDGNYSEIETFAKALDREDPMPEMLSGEDSGGKSIGGSNKARITNSVPGKQPGQGKRAKRGSDYAQKNPEDQKTRDKTDSPEPAAQKQRRKQNRKPLPAEAQQPRAETARNSNKKPNKRRRYGKPRQGGGSAEGPKTE